MIIMYVFMYVYIYIYMYTYTYAPGRVAVPRRRDRVHEVQLGDLTDEIGTPDPTRAPDKKKKNS